MSAFTTSEPQASAGSRRLQRRTVAEQTTDEIRRRILAGEFKDGDPLRQDLLAEELGVSRIPVREALQRLEGEGLVVHQPHKGAVVTALSLQEIEELFDLRALLEPELMRLAVPRMTPKDLDEIQLAHDAFDKALESADVHVWGELNTRFHLALYAPAGRKRTFDIVRSLLVNTDRYTRIALVLTDGEQLARLHHDALIELCRQGKADEAAAVVREHVEYGSRDLRAALAAQHLSEPGR
jgi:DNA-binding GntR family transcriptional regulator